MAIKDWRKTYQSKVSAIYEHKTKDREIRVSNASNSVQLRKKKYGKSIFVRKFKTQLAAAKSALAYMRKH